MSGGGEWFEQPTSPISASDKRTLYKIRVDTYHCPHFPQRFVGNIIFRHTITTKSFTYVFCTRFYCEKSITD